MTPTRIGFDLVAVDEVRAAVAERGDRYLQRVYSHRELTDTRARPHRLAACFAAKEAAMKALGPGAGGLGWRSIELITERPATMPKIELSAGAAELAAGLGVQRVAVSVTYSRDHAAAVVTMKESL